MTDPCRAEEKLYRAAEMFRRSVGRDARGPWRWADPDPEAGYAERLGRPTSLKNLSAFPTRSTGRPEPGSSARDPIDVVDEALQGVAPVPQTAVRSAPVRGAAAIGPAVALPLAALLDALARQLGATIDAGGSLNDEPYRSALQLAAAILDGSAA